MRRASWLLGLAVIFGSMTGQLVHGSAQAQQNIAHEQERQAWAFRVSTHLVRFTTNPDIAKRLSCEETREGRTMVQFSIDRAGRVANVRIVTSARIRDLDQAVIAAVRKASPVPPPPASVQGAVLDLQLPVTFISKCTSSMDGG